MYGSRNFTKADSGESIRASQGIGIGLIISAPLWALLIRALL